MTFGRRSAFTQDPVIADLRPEDAAGGVVRDDGEIHFFVRANALLQPNMTVIDFGAGRGAIFAGRDRDTFRGKLAKLQGKAKKVIGIDIDEDLLQHPYLDEKYTVNPTAPLPVGDGSVDLIVANWVFEHIEDPNHLAREFFRILKPGGWIWARTPHRWGYVGIGTRLLSHRLQIALKRVGNPQFKERDKFPTLYRLNSFRALRKYFPDSDWEHYSYGLNSTPSYYLGSHLLFSVLSVYHIIAWPKTDLFVLLRKNANEGFFREFRGIPSLGL